MKSKKALYNIVSEFIYQVVVVICSFILPKLILKEYGSEYNGVVSSITQFLNYVSILTLGISGSTRVAIYKAKGDTIKISKIIKATQNYMKKVSIMYIMYMIVLMVIYPIVLNSTLLPLEMSLLVLIIGAGTFFEYSFGVSYSSLISALQCKYIYNIILIFLKIVSTVVSVLLIVDGKNILFVKVVGSVFFALGPVILKYIINKKYNLVSNIEPDTNALEYKKDVMAHSVANCVYEYTDVFLLSLFTNPKIISIYSVYNLFLNGISKVQSLFTNGLEGAFGETWARGNVEEFKKNFNIFEFLIFSLISVIFSCTFILLIPIIKLYTKGINDVNYIIPLYAYMTIFSSMFYCLRTPYVVAVQSAGKYKETKKIAIMEALINFLLSLVLIFPFGIVGVTIGTLVANLFRIVKYEIFISKELINRKNFIFIKRVLWTGLCIAIVIGINIILPKFEIDSWIKWIAFGLCYFILSLIVTLSMAFVCYKDELKYSYSIIKRMFSKKRKEVI